MALCIVRYLPMGNDDTDPAAFYGWCREKATTENVFKRVCNDYPNWVSMVTQVQGKIRGR